MKFSSSVQKLAWGGYHLTQFEESLKTYHAPLNSEKIWNEEEQVFDLLFRMTEPTPVEWQLRLGDVLSNFRSALDHALIACIHPSIEAKEYFPICTSEEKFETILTKLSRLMPLEKIEILRSIRPVKGHNHLLWALNDLRNRDTHNYLIPTRSLIASHNVSGTIYYKAVPFFQAGRLDEGVVVAKIERDGAVVIGDYRLDVALIFEASAYHFGGKDVVASMNEVRDEIARVIGLMFAQELSAADA